MKVFELLNETPNRSFQRLVLASKGVRTELTSGLSHELNKLEKIEDAKDKKQLKKLKKLQKIDDEYDLDAEKFELSQILKKFKPVKKLKNQ